MAKKETISQFAANFSKLDNKVQALTLREWDRNTQIVLGEAKKRAPVASGNLSESGATRTATVTKNGISSAVEFRVPYAFKLNIPSPPSTIRLKEAKELSYITPGGTQVFKKQKGEHGFLNNAISDREKGIPNFIRSVDEAISKAWDSI